MPYEFDIEAPRILSPSTRQPLIVACFFAATRRLFQRFMPDTMARLFMVFPRSSTVAFD